ncbi:MAG: hypothetical protein PHF33_05165 [Candidatus Delongbacteria bacterium]|nr:hypothetical protein [Candidatus Delongbacteria bacterium]
MEIVAKLWKNMKNNRCYLRKVYGYFIFLVNNRRQNVKKIFISLLLILSFLVLNAQEKEVKLYEKIKQENSSVTILENYLLNSGYTIEETELENGGI